VVRGSADVSGATGWEEDIDDSHREAAAAAAGGGVGLGTGASEAPTSLHRLLRRT